MLERDFQRRVTDMATRFGWSYWHVPAPMRWAPTNKAYVPARSAAGLADLILTHHDPPRVVFMELKGDGGKLSEAQTEFLKAVQTVKDAVQAQYALGGMYDPPGTPVGVYAFWPKDEPAIEQLLRSKILT